MRSDMSKVIVERPRKGGGSARKGRTRDFEMLPTREGMGRAAKLCGDYKYLNENLAPLRRYLERQVGRPWSKVYSEISEHLRADNAVQQHVRDHIRDFVELNPRRDPQSRYALPPWPWYQPLYVDPRDGLLKRTDRLPEVKAARRRMPKQEEREHIVLSQELELRRIGGIWYAITLARLPAPVYRDVRLYSGGTIRRLATPPVRDVMTGAYLPAGPEFDEAAGWKDYRKRDFGTWYAAGKRALARRELRRFGLSNEPSH
jgi:hypothetical protein